MGCSVGGIVVGNEGFGRMCTASDEHSVTGLVSRPESRRWLVMQPRRTLYWRRVIRWSEERGNMMLIEDCLSDLAGFVVAGW